jgi:hypothetical protein
MILRRSISCPTCAYDLNGLEISGQCPECRSPVRDAVSAVIDPYGSSLPPLANPRLAGNALIFFSACAVVACLGLWLPWGSDPYAGGALGQLDGFETGLLAPMMSSGLLLLAAAAMLGGVWVAVVLRPRDVLDEGPRVRRYLWTIGIACTIGAILTGVVAVQWSGLVDNVLPTSPMGVYLTLQLPLLICCAAALLGFRGVLIHIGERCRIFREGGRSRQRIADLLAAIGVIAVGFGIAQMGLSWNSLPLQVIGRITVILCGLMLLLGLGYLHYNTWWIRKAILDPPPSLEELLTAERCSEAVDAEA